MDPTSHGQRVSISLSFRLRADSKLSTVTPMRKWSALKLNPAPDKYPGNISPRTNVARSCRGIRKVAKTENGFEVHEHMWSNEVFTAYVDEVAGEGCWKNKMQPRMKQIVTWSLLCAQVRTGGGVLIRLNYNGIVAVSLFDLSFCVRSGSCSYFFSVPPMSPTSPLTNA